MKQTKKNTHCTRLNLIGTQSIQWSYYHMPLFVYMNVKNVHLMHRCTLKKALHSERQTSEVIERRKIGESLND